MCIDSFSSNPYYTMAHNKKPLLSSCHSPFIKVYNNFKALTKKLVALNMLNKELTIHKTIHTTEPVCVKDTISNSVSPENYSNNACNYSIYPILSKNMHPFSVTHMRNEEKKPKLSMKKAEET